MLREMRILQRLFPVLPCHPATCMGAFSRELFHASTSGDLMQASQPSNPAQPFLAWRRVSPSSASSRNSTVGMQRPNHLPLTNRGPGQTLLYPFPIQHYKDREAIVYDKSLKPTGVERLDGQVFNCPVRIDILHRVVRYLMALWQQGTHKAKTRGQVSGGSRKPWPQKKTGRSRQGSIRSPLWKGGGASFGPIPRSHAHKLPAKIQLMGMKCALSAKCNEGRLVLVDTLSSDNNGGRTPPLHPSVMASILQSLVAKGSAGSIPQAQKQPRGTPKQLTSPVPGAAPVDARPQGQKKLTALIVDCGEYGRDGGKQLRRCVQSMGVDFDYQIMSEDEVTVYHILRQQVLVMTRPALLKISQRCLPSSTPQHNILRAEWYEREKKAFHQAEVDLDRASFHSSSVQA